METKGTETLTGLTVDLSQRISRKIERANNEQKHAVALIINDSEIQRLENLETYSSLKKLSLINNQVIRMHGVSQLIHLEVLNLSNNALVTIEGLKDLKNLKELYLAKNRIKIIEHLNSNLYLEKLDVSENSVTHISDISHLKCLKEVYLHGNKITHLRQCEKNFPENIEYLTLHDNSICDLNEVSHLMQFNSIKELTFHGNPCVDFSKTGIMFNYRPYIKNWCGGLTILDSRPLDDIECLKAEWLYSQGRGRSFKPGEQAALVEYLANVCPPKEPDDETEDLKKLRLILSKAQQHQKQLKEQLSAGNLPLQDELKLPKKKKGSGIPDKMVTSYQSSIQRSRKYSPDLMTRSLDSGITRHSSYTKNIKGEAQQTPLQTSSTFIPVPDTLISPDVAHKNASFLTSQYRQRPSSLSSRTSKSSSANSPQATPDIKRKNSTTSTRKPNECFSPLFLKKQQKLSNSRSGTPSHRSPLAANHSPQLGSKGNRRKNPEINQSKITSDDEDCEMQKKRTHPVVTRTLENRIVQNDKFDSSFEKTEESESEEKAWKAAVCIQRRWRGYRTRHLNREVATVYKDIQLNRIQEYMTKVISEMEATRSALESNRKLQVLQMQAINALWKKMTSPRSAESLENANESALTLQQLMATCSSLNRQVEELQNMMKNFLHSSTSEPIGTQTEIVAVFTPQGHDKHTFPYISANVKNSDEDNRISFEEENECRNTCEIESISSPEPPNVEQSHAGNSSDQDYFTAILIDDSDVKRSPETEKESKLSVGQLEEGSDGYNENTS